MRQAFCLVAFFFLTVSKCASLDESSFVAGLQTMIDTSNAVLQLSLEAYQANTSMASPAALASTSARRMMLTTHSAINATIKSNIQKVSARVSLLSSDAWAISYTAFKTARAAIQLLTGYLKASATGTIVVDNLSLLDFVATVAALNGEISDLLSKISKLNADAVTPLGLTKN